jgi:hypothetical protein
MMQPRDRKKSNDHFRSPFGAAAVPGLTRNLTLYSTSSVAQQIRVPVPRHSLSGNWHYDHWRESHSIIANVPMVHMRAYL